MKSKIIDQFEKYFERIATRSRGNSLNYYRVESSQKLHFVNEIEKLRIEQVIAKAIIDFEAESSINMSLIRADAKVLLVINFSDMVYYPLTRSGYEKESLLKREIYSEVQVILKEALKDNVEISSHKILEVGLKLWARLKTLGNDSW